MDLANGRWLWPWLATRKLHIPLAPAASLLRTRLSRASPSCAVAKGSSRTLYYRWSKEFLEAGKQRLAGDTARAATSEEVKELRRETSALKEVVAELTL